MRRRGKGRGGGGRKNGLAFCGSCEDAGDSGGMEEEGMLIITKHNLKKKKKKKKKKTFSQNSPKAQPFHYREKQRQKNEFHVLLLPSFLSLLPSLLPLRCGEKKGEESGRGGKK